MGPKDAERMTDAIDEHDLDHVFVEFPDLNGMSRSKQLAADYFRSSWRDGFSMNVSLLTQTPRSDVVDGSRYGDEINYADGVVYPDPDTFCLVPWRDDAARVVCDFEYRGDPVADAPRTVLRRVLDRVADAGFDASVGSELEFFLLDPVDGGYEPATSDKHENLTRATESISDFYDRVYDWAGAFDVSLTTLHHEYGAGQFEILFEHDAPLPQADQTFRFKELVKYAATVGDQEATFMAKPFTGQSGSGYHLHTSLFADGENVLETGERAGSKAAPDGGPELSETGRHFVGGLLEHADSLTALGTPTLNGFKRHQPHTFAPYTASWGYGNRYATVRVPTQGTTRIENRIPSADANPYLVIAATLAAGLHGIEDGIDPGDPSSDDPADSRSRLPRSPHEALAALETDDVLVDSLGEDVISEYVLMKRQEIDHFYDETVWERDRYVKPL